MIFRVLSTMLFLSLTIVLLSVPSNHVSAQLGCEPLVYNSASSNNIDNSVWGWSYCFNGNAGDAVAVTMNATSGDLDTYLEFSDTNGTLAFNRTVNKNPANSFIEYTLPATGAYTIYAGRHGIDTGTTTGTFLLSLALATETCNNVAVSMDFIGEGFSIDPKTNQQLPNQQLALLDDNDTTGWVSNDTLNELWFDVVLNGMQTVTSIEFKSLPVARIAENSVNGFTLTRWSPDEGAFETILDLESSKQIGYQTYNFPAVETESFTFTMFTNHGGSIFEVTDIKVCAESTGGDNTAGRPTSSNTAGRPTSSNTNQTQPIVPTVQTAVPCTVQATQDAALRVGPGGNRSIVLYLTAGATFDVIGTANADDGTRWWRLDKTKAAPNKAAQVNETWVSDAQMTEFGDCDAVGTVAPPRIIRARPTAAPTSTGNTTSPQPTAQATPQEGSTNAFISFSADYYNISETECTTFSWDVRNIKGVYFIDSLGSEKAVTGPTGSETVCPEAFLGQDTTHTFALRVVPLSGDDIYNYIDILVRVVTFPTCDMQYTGMTEFGTISDGEVHSYSIFVDPGCDVTATVYISVLKDSGDLDPYMDVYTNGSYYGSDDDGGQNLDSFMQLEVTGSTEIRIDVSNLFAGGTGDYTVDVYIESFRA